MDTMPSSEFRKRYASLTGPTEVTVNGHVIGAWVPSWGETWRVLRQHVGAEEGKARAIRDLDLPAGTRLDLDTTPVLRAFTPAPKPSQRRK